MFPVCLHEVNVAVQRKELISHSAMVMVENVYDI